MMLESSGWITFTSQLYGINSKWGQSGATRVPCCWCRDGVNGDELLRTNMVVNCIFTLQDTARRTIWRRKPSLKGFSVVFAVTQTKLIKRSPAKRAQWSWKETAQMKPEITKQRYLFCFHRAFVSSRYQLKSPVLIRLTSAETKTPLNQTKSRSQRIDGRNQQDLRRNCAVICLL